MTSPFRRRELLLSGTAIALGGTRDRKSEVQAQSPASVLKKGVCMAVLPEKMTILQKLEAAKKAGFEGIEPNTIQKEEEVKQYKEAAERTGVKICSIMNSDHWRYPLSDRDPEVVKKCVEGLKTSMRNAHDLGAGTVLLVPAVVTAEVRYVEAYKRSQDQIRKLLPLAKNLRVTLAVEDVGNRFLLSPLEFARYVDDFKSPWVKAYFDIGNIVSSGYPQDWIRTLGKRICRVHIKRFEPGTEYPKYDPKDRRTQGINWADVHLALKEIGYSGWVTAEIRGGDENYLKEVSTRLDRILAGLDPA
jgi:L-ribulose-5-phosphate 3-epimerase